MNRGSIGILTNCRDVLGDVVCYAYGGCGGCGQSGGILTTVTDALSRATAYEYDTMNQLTKGVSPAGGAKYMQSTCDRFGRIITKRDSWGKNREY